MVSIAAPREWPGTAKKHFGEIIDQLLMVERTYEFRGKMVKVDFGDGKCVRKDAAAQGWEVGAELRKSDVAWWSRSNGQRSAKRFFFGEAFALCRMRTTVDQQSEHSLGL